MDAAYRSSTPRADIIDTARHSRTITLDDAVDLLHRKEILDSFTSDNTNGWSPSLLPCAKSGQRDISDQVSSGVALQAASTKEVTKTDPTEARLSHISTTCPQPTNHTGGSTSPRLSSKLLSFTNLMKRMSITRRKRDTVSVTHPAPLPVASEKTESRGPRHSRLRRWLTRRPTKSKAAESNFTCDMKGSRDTRDSVAQIPPRVNGAVPAVIPPSHDRDTSIRPINVHVKVSTSVRSPDDLQSSLHASINGETSFARDLLSRLDRWQSLPRDEPSAGTPCTLVRKQSERSEGKSHVHFSSNTLSNQNDPAQYGPRCFLSDAELFQNQSTGRKHGKIIPISKDKPSYLSISLAAFGYSGHSREPWLIDDSKPFRPTNLSLSPSPVTRHLVDSDSRHEPISSPNSPRTLAATSQNVSKTDESTVEPTALSLVIPKDSDHHNNNEASPSSPSHSSLSESVTHRPRLRKSTNRTSTPDDHEHWQRSSLIMFAVAQASPRPKPLSGEIEPNGISCSDLKRDSFVGSEDAKPDSSSVNLVNGHRETERTTEHSPHIGESLEKGVDHFIRQVDLSQAAIMSLVDQAESDLKNESLDSEVSGLIRTAVGKARLLMTEKFAQFRGLCQQNIEWERSKDINEAGVLPTLLSDLDGFWAMVELQVTDVHKMFDEVQLLRSNGWKNLDSSVPITNGHSQEKRVIRSPSTIPPKKSRKKTSIKSSEDTAARQKARERLESLKREMRAKKLSAETNGSGDGFLII